MTTNDLKQKYSSRAAILYKDKLASQALTAVKSWEGHLHIDTSHGSGGGPSSPEPRRLSTDFFTEIESTHVQGSSSTRSLSSLKPKDAEIKPAEVGSSSLMAAASSVQKRTPVASKKPVSIPCQSEASETRQSTARDDYLQDHFFPEVCQINQ